MLLFMCHLAVHSQIKGTIKAENKPLPNIKIENQTQRTYTFSDDAGQFKIAAELKDTLLINDVFYEYQQWIVNDQILENGIAINLNKKEFGLDEIVLIAPSKKFDAEKYDADLKLQVKKDMEEHPYLYRPPGSYAGGANLFALVGLAVKGVGSLLGIEKKPKEVISFVSFEDLENLFNQDDFFNDELLENTLKIQPDQKYLFFSFCEDRNINSYLLEPENHFLLLDKLLTHARSFNKRAEEE